MMRRVLGKPRGIPVTITVDGRRIAAFEGESVAAALGAAGLLSLQRGPDGQSRGAFCFMGSCQQCTVLIDGARVEACRLQASDGLAIGLSL